MSTAELKSYVDERSPEERRWLAQYLWETECQQDTAALADCDRRMDEMATGKNVMDWAEAVVRLDKLEQRGKQ